MGKKKSTSEEYFDEQPAAAPDDGEYRSTSTIDNPPKECAESTGNAAQLTLPGIGAYFTVKVAVTLIGETRKAALSEDLGMLKAGSVEVELQKLFQTLSFLSWLRGVVGEPAPAAVDVKPADPAQKVVGYIRHIEGERWEFQCSKIGATDWSWNAAADAPRKDAVAHAAERIRAAGYTGEIEILDDPLPDVLRGSTKDGGYKPGAAPYTANVTHYDDTHPAGRLV